MQVRVNKISVNVGDVTEITLYNNNKKLVMIINKDIGVPDYSVANNIVDMTKPMYAQYCRDVVINLLKNGGIEGFYYEHKQKSDTDRVSKFDSSTFIGAAIKIVNDTISNMVDGTVINMESHWVHDSTNVTSRYKNGYISYADLKIDVILTKGDTKIKLVIPVEIKSGQLCKPKKMFIGDKFINLNTTNILKLF